MKQPIVMTEEELQAWRKESESFYDKHKKTAIMYGQWWDYEYGYDEPKEDDKCKHEWKEDKWFTKQVFITCVKCGAKKEEVVK